MLTFLGDNQEQTDKISQASQALCCFKYVTVDSAWINLYTIIGDSTNQSQFLDRTTERLAENYRRTTHRQSDLKRRNFWPEAIPDLWSYTDPTWLANEQH
ncbi:hypothetical protein RRG08_040874 [Elysia crispata]|uniref:Uncharacterized protein n=1 Tax=Elysia crispata TaxID=231223 RepID=A0AAE1E7Y0_9GAST|nr:hypothetical protein RRG08_040874 [Elysia crispata]